MQGKIILAPEEAAQICFNLMLTNKSMTRPRQLVLYHLLQSDEAIDYHDLGELIEIDYGTVRNYVSSIRAVGVDILGSKGKFFVADEVKLQLKKKYIL